MWDRDKRRRRSLMAGRARGGAVQRISNCLVHLSKCLPAVANCQQPLSLGAAMLKLVEEA